MNGVCCTEDVVYWDEVSDDSGQRKIHICCTKSSFKKHWFTHPFSFRVQKHRYNTKLVGHAWKLKEQHGKSPSIMWSILRWVRSGRTSGSNCRLCQEEKMVWWLHIRTMQCCWAREKKSCQNVNMWARMYSACTTLDEEK